MTPFPAFIDQVASAVLAPATVAENPHHRAILDTFTEIQHLDRQLANMAEEEPATDMSADEQLDELTDLLIERMAVGAELNALLAATCCCATADTTSDSLDEHSSGFADPTDNFTDGNVSPAASQPETVVDACLAIFDTLDNPEYVAAPDLIERLRDLPGQAEGRWPYAEINPQRLARLLIPHGVRSCRPVASDGSRYRAYRRSDLLAARKGDSS